MSILTGLNVIFIVFVLFFERAESSRRFVWLLILFFLPGAGGILYILLSGHFFTGSHRMKQMSAVTKGIFEPVLNEQRSYIFWNSERISSGVVKDYLPLIRMNLNSSDSLIVSTDTTEIYTDGKDFFEALCGELEKAEKTIFMEYFIFHEDKIGRRIMDILCRKAGEGVVVKLMYDDLGSLFTKTKFFRRLNAAGGQARPFFQIRVGLPFTLNYRNHRKLTLIDGKIAFTGGMNIGDEYANQSKKRHLNWRDTVVRMTGMSVLLMQGNFLMDWYFQDAWMDRAKTIEHARKYFPGELLGDVKEIIVNEGPALWRRLFSSDAIPTQIVTAGPNDMRKADIENALVKMIMSAHESVYLQTPYFTPDDEFSTALRIASYSGVRVEIIIPRDWDKWYMRDASYEFVREMMGDGIKFYLYPGFIHSKMMVVDGKVATIGTTNIDERSFNLHYEQNVFFYQEAFAAKCENIFVKDRGKCLPASEEYFHSKFILRRAVWSFCKLFSPLM